MTAKASKFWKLPPGSGAGAASAGFWPARSWIVLPLLLLCVMVLFAPHALDVAISKPFFDGTGWPLHGNALFTEIFHKDLKFVPIAAAVSALLLLVQAFAARRFGRTPWAARWFAEPEKRLLYLLAAMGACVLLVWWLKGTTGVVCPWNAEPFGGKSAVTDPSFSLFFRSGKCWPGGHAGTGFCLFSLYFMLRDEHPKAARWAFIFAFLLGVVCGVTRLMQGAHFASHNVATMLIDWLVCASVYALVFTPRTVLENLIGALTSPMRLRSAVLFTALWWTIVFDMPLSSKLLDRAGADSVGFLFAVLAAFFLVGTALLTLLSILPRKVFSGVLVFFAVCGAAAFTGSTLYGVVFTPDMVRNILATDAHEASQYLSLRTAAIALFAAVPPIWAAVLAGRRPEAVQGAAQGSHPAHPARFANWTNWRAAGPRIRAARKSTGLRFLGTVFLLALGVGLILLNFQTFAGLMRADKTLRYLIAPVNIVYSAVRTIAADASPDGKRVRAVIAPAPALAAKPEAPTLFVVFVGETTRAANWQLSGYERQTTPKLARVKDLIAFPKVEACGTSTDVSLPCMMSRIGRSDYDRDRILGEEALPDVLQRAGANVLWIDNQSGCKGVCAGVPNRHAEEDPENCPDGVCFDSDFTKEIGNALAKIEAEKAAGKRGTTVLFLHMYGSHGPAYYKASPEMRKAFGPECRAADLSSCPVEEIRNAYDNSVLETDSSLADAIAALRSAADEKGIRTGLLWVSDHGESLGENGLFLHGAPRVMAPEEQLAVPMVVWLSEGFEKDYGVDRSALLQSAKASDELGAVTHENLYSTVLGLLNVKSSTYRRDYDLSKAAE